MPVETLQETVPKPHQEILKLRAGVLPFIALVCLLASCATHRPAAQNEAAEWRPALLAAIHLNDVEAVARLYSKYSLPPDASINANSVTPLMIASSQGSGFVVQWLLRRGAKVDAGSTDKNPGEFPQTAGCTPLLMACAGGHSQIALELLAHGADVSHEDSRGSTPLVIACGRGRLEIARLLLDHGAKINSPSNAPPLLRAIQQDQPAIAEFLISQGADINASFAIGRSALMVASERGNASLVRLLLEKGAAVNRIDADGQHALLETAIEGHAEVVSLLVGHGALIDLQDRAGWTALMQASAAGFPESVKVLCAAGADPTKTNKFGRTALIYARGIEGTRNLAQVADLTAATERGVFDPEELYYVLKRNSSGRDYAGVLKILEPYEKGFHKQTVPAGGSQPAGSQTNRPSGPAN